MTLPPQISPQSIIEQTEALQKEPGVRGVSLDRLLENRKLSNPQVDNKADPKLNAGAHVRLTNIHISEDNQNCHQSEEESFLSLASSAEIDSLSPKKKPDEENITLNVAALQQSNQLETLATFDASTPKKSPGEKSARQRYSKKKNDASIPKLMAVSTSTKQSSNKKTPVSHFCQRPP